MDATRRPPLGVPQRPAKASTLTITRGDPEVAPAYALTGASRRQSRPHGSRIRPVATCLTPKWILMSRWLMGHQVEDPHVTSEPSNENSDPQPHLTPRASQACTTRSNSPAPNPLGVSQKTWRGLGSNGCEQGGSSYLHFEAMQGDF
jgi:hypothetical protein